MQFTRDELIAASQQPQLKTLQIILKLLEPGWALNVYNQGNSVTIVDGDTRQILINAMQEINRGLVDLSWEVTNAINSATRLQLTEEAKVQKISAYEFVMGIHRMEAEAQFSAMKTASEIGFDLRTYAFSSASVDAFTLFWEEKITDTELIDTIAMEHYDKGMITDMQGNKDFARNIYEKQYHMLSTSVT
ncbi:MAG: hypothetical protein IPO27_08500 [Bacteroidetes bacterium]|nr:hypothetical protein [Bacteroidota bacterium]